MTQKILVTYATRAGSTAGVAEAIAAYLRETGQVVDVQPAQNVKDVTPYGAVVAGSAIQGSKWLPEGMAFLQNNQAALQRVPFAAFLVCITLSMKGSDQYRQGVARWMDPVRALVHPVSEGMFAGCLDFQKIPFSFNALLMRVPVALGIWKTGDHRDWQAIRGWAAQIRPLLAA